MCALKGISLLDDKIIPPPEPPSATLFSIIQLEISRWDSESSLVIKIPAPDPGSPFSLVALLFLIVV